ncbi:Interferon-induced transmembrane protein 1 [Galemys pyrenaicus]|uniref:Interferon-induced transmembrane protein 1 n=1 Tax=Galemys pyrenaicus TaxID=202257 RepID=A0A8J6ABG8_GALPY|nr:Interferon-induced transmembrane protein 1 [Galemys pyrenaicus]
MVGDTSGARSYASTAKCLNIWALCLGLLLNAGLIALVVYMGLAAYTAVQATIQSTIQEGGGY